MNAATTQHNWKPFLKIFSEQNISRPTRLGIFKGEPGTMTDYWIENGLPLAGVTAGGQEENLTIEILLGDTARGGTRHLTHMVNKARQLKIILNAAGTADGLEVVDDEGKTTILRFEA